MKKIVIAVCFVCMSMMAAKAEMFTYYLDDLAAAISAPGEICSSAGKRIVICRCGTGQDPRPASGRAETLCDSGADSEGGMPMSEWGCKFEGGWSDNTQGYCLDVEGGGNACSWCGCQDVSSDSDWKSVGSNRVSHTVQTTSSSGYECRVTSTTQYGCAAGYYQSAGTGASMTCTRCPAVNGVYGTNANGTTDITTCTLDKSTKMTDTVGTYECSVDYKYSK